MRLIITIIIHLYIIVHLIKLLVYAWHFSGLWLGRYILLSSLTPYAAERGGGGHRGTVPPVKFSRGGAPIVKCPPPLNMPLNYIFKSSFSFKTRKFLSSSVSFHKSSNSMRLGYRYCNLHDVNIGSVDDMWKVSPLKLHVWWISANFFFVFFGLALKAVPPVPKSSSKTLS